MAGCPTALTACTVPTLQDKRLENTDPRALARSEPGPPSRVLLLTVSGLEADDYLDPWGFAAREGAPVRMPVLAGLAREGVVVVTLIVVSFITMRISDFILDSRIGALDRTTESSNLLES